MFNTANAPSIIYELTEAHADGRYLSRFFDGNNVLKSRETALKEFLRTYYEEMEDVILTLYVRHLPTFQCVELINSMSYGCFWELARGLEKELSFYEKEKLVTFIAIINSEKEDSIEVYWPRTAFHHLWKTKHHHFLLYGSYWILPLAESKKNFFPTEHHFTWYVQPLDQHHV